MPEGSLGQHTEENAFPALGWVEFKPPFSTCVGPEGIALEHEGTRAVTLLSFMTCNDVYPRM